MGSVNWWQGLCSQQVSGQVLNRDPLFVSSGQALWRPALQLLRPCRADGPEARTAVPWTNELTLVKGRGRCGPRGAWFHHPTLPSAQRPNARACPMPLHEPHTCDRVHTHTDMLGKPKRPPASRDCCPWAFLSRDCPVTEHGSPSTH